jgi:SET domain-containing protein
MDHDWIVFRASPIHGMGGFARRAVPRGTSVIEYQGRRIDKAESLRQCELENPYIFALDDTFDLDGNVEWNPARLLNHSCAPNCEAENLDGRIWIVAAREILEGEEITFNYGYDLDSYREHPCQCGALRCVGYIVAEEHFPQVCGRAC